jgi:hypothetical protein
MPGTERQQAMAHGWKRVLLLWFARELVVDNCSVCACKQTSFAAVCFEVKLHLPVC